MGRLVFSREQQKSCNFSESAENLTVKLSAETTLNKKLKFMENYVINAARFHPFIPEVEFEVYTFKAYSIPKRLKLFLANFKESSMISNKLVMSSLLLLIIRLA